MRIGLVTGEERLFALLKAGVEECGHKACQYTTLREGVEAGPDLLFFEWQEGPNLGAVLDGIQAAGALVDPIPVVALVPAGRVITMRRAQAAGAADVLFCPPEVDEIRAEIEEVSARARGGDVIDRDLFQEIVQESLVGEGSRFRKCLEELKRAARCDANVLLVGETGTGKEMLAKAIHRLSRRATGPYLPVNCASLPGTLLESELFGHARGAFTGAQSARLGRFETVGAGTLLLDEVGDIEPALQIKLLRVIEQREFQRLGENTAVKFNGRLICAASVGLDEAVAAGRFRKDLLGRIDQFRISMPALRERRLDIPILLRHFLRKHGQARKVGISRPAMDLLESYDYPMNVRQLENAVVSALARSDPGTLILPQHLPAEIKATAPSEGKQDCHAILVPRSSKYEDARSLVIREVDRIYLGALLDKHHGNRSRAAAEAGVDRGTFTERAKQALGEKDEGPHA